ncbi:hypothetical protein ATX62_02330 [Oenococcus oeni]|nr:hypothetical protein ATW62_02315 [Oenococcus oeni]OIK88049.1 hypothetical protein ATW79_02385 [Oenococcus oeni]OIL33851.1 hypothetical protein ATX07_02405 [Oenococcus oeni]OIL53363.1 hypothetical protein ATX20_02590 [Oenococcus oeni]OIL74152.1 hypothetical protein ATX33_02425 [Oenococcus oeni]
MTAETIKPKMTIYKLNPPLRLDKLPDINIIESPGKKGTKIKPVSVKIIKNKNPYTNKAFVFINSGKI